MRDDLWEFVRASGQYHTRDQLSAWMRGTFGEPSGPDLDAARSAADLPEADLSRPLPPPQPGAAGPDLSDRSLYGDEDVDNMTIVDSDLQSRLRVGVGVEDADTVAAEADESLLGGLGAGEAGRVPALRDLAEAAQSEPERAVFLRGDEGKLLERARRESRAVRGELEVRPGGLGARSPRQDAHDEEETTSARDELPAGGGAGPLSPSAAWFEPQTPTRPRPVAGDADDEVAIIDRDRFAPPGPPSMPSSPMPQGMAQSMTAAPDARTIGPAQEMMAPQLPPQLPLPPHGPPPHAQPGAGFGPPPYPMQGELGPPGPMQGELGPPGPMQGGMPGPPGRCVRPATDAARRVRRRVRGSVRSSARDVAGPAHAAQRGVGPRRALLRHRSDLRPGRRGDSEYRPRSDGRMSLC